MTTAAPPQGEPSLLRIEGEMTAYRARALKQTLLAGLSDSAALVLDLSSVSAIDTAGVQLLLLISKTAAAAHKTLKITSTSSAVSAALTLFNLNEDLHVAAVAPTSAPIPAPAAAS